MFFDKQKKEKRYLYGKMLTAVGALTRLSSESVEPYLGYRQVENIFCMAFDAKNVSREDLAVDAVKGGIGIGIKTFLNKNGKTLQKIAEFNRFSSLFRSASSLREVVEKVSELRNERIGFARRSYGLTDLIYHCVVREERKIKVFECPMVEVDLENIRKINSRDNTISFKDGKNEYSFNLSKSTLYKRFITQNVLLELDVKILGNPYEAILNLLGERLDLAPLLEEKWDLASLREAEEYVVLPLFSDRGGRHVPERSGLNQWNANGRPRNSDEVYIPIPIWIHRKFPDFFPPREESFELFLPDGAALSAKICQEGGKALMSNPNSALGEWLLRKVLNLKEGELLTYSWLEELGIDSVVVRKRTDGSYSIDFAEIGSYDLFCEENRER